MFPYFCVSMLFKSLLKKIQFKSSLHYIDIIAYHCMILWSEYYLSWKSEYYLSWTLIYFLRKLAFFKAFEMIINFQCFDSVQCTVYGVQCTVYNCTYKMLPKLVYWNEYQDLASNITREKPPIKLYLLKYLRKASNKALSDGIPEKSLQLWLYLLEYLRKSSDHDSICLNTWENPPIMTLSA